MSDGSTSKEEHSMSVTSFIVKVGASTGHVAGRPSAIGGIVDMAERYGGQAAFGFIHGMYKEKAEIKGIPVDILAGILLKGSAIALDMYGHGRSKAAPHLNALGDAGIGSFFHSLGTGLGHHMSGDQAPAQAALPAAKKPATISGAIPPAPVGDFLNTQNLADLARRYRSNQA